MAKKTNIYTFEKATVIRGIKVIIEANFEEMSKRASHIVAKHINKKASLILGLATGSTPLGLYKELIRMQKEEGLDFSQITTFNLDEYVGLAKEHPQSYHYFMKENLFKHINIKEENIFILDGKSKDPHLECLKFEELILNRGPIDLQILGIGRNGHIAFNEPDSSRNSRTRVVDLAEATIKDNSRFFKDVNEVPRQALTMGIGTILETREILLLANGKNKADAVAKALEGKVTEEVPASLLQEHSNVTFILDEEAASALNWLNLTKIFLEMATKKSSRLVTRMLS